MHKAISIIFFINALLILPIISFAQGNLPCEDADPYGTPCPLDTWVWVLVIATALLGAKYLYHQKQNVQRKA